jgi:hypothetical protein
VRNIPISPWEDDGDTNEGPPHDELDRAHESDARGEHRYRDKHQKESEIDARRSRDELKRRLGTPKHVPRK